MAARRLKSLDAKYYALLYTLELEMLYYYVEPIILKMVKSIISHYGIPVEELLEIIKGNLMFKSIISLIITDILVPLGMIAIGIIFMTFIPDYYWVPPTIICIVIYLYIWQKSWKNMMN